MSKSKFDELLAELEGLQDTMTKALDAGDGKEDDEDEYIRSMADGDSDDDGVPDNEDEDEEGDDEEIMSKSMLLEIDGEPYNAIDGTALLKSLSAMTTRHKSEMDEVAEVFTGMKATLKALAVTVERLGRDNTMLKAKIAEIGGKPRDRKSQLSVVEPVKGEEQKRGDVASAKEQIMAKAQTLLDAGKLSALEFTTLDVGLRDRVNPNDPGLAQVLHKLAAAEE